MHHRHDRAPREHVLDARAAQHWLAERGFAGRGPSHLIADEIAVPDFRAARVWHSAAALERQAAPGIVYVVLIADGAAETSAEGGLREVGAGHLVVAPRDGVLLLRSADRVARFEFEVRAEELPLAPPVARELERGVVAPDAAPSFRPVLLATMNAGFNAELGPRSAGFASYRLAVTSLLGALLDEALARRADGRSTREAVLHRRALHAIAVHAADPGFSAASLAQVLNISGRHLRRVFEGHGITPAAALRDARLQRVRTLQAAPTPPPLRETARIAGFRSSRALRRAAAGDRDPAA